MAVRFSLAGNPGKRDAASEVERFILADELGYEGICLSESLMSGPDPFQLMAVAATRTRRVKLGTAIMTMSFREPMVIAQQVATLNEISDGRAFLGLGTGDGTTYTMARTATPLTRFEDGVRTIRELVNGRTIHVPAGKERQAGDLPLRGGKFPVPVYVAAAGPRAMRMAGRVADGVILGSGLEARVLQWAREQVALGAKDAGRDPAEIRLIGAGIMCVDDDGNRARQLARARLPNRAHHNFRFTLETVPPEEQASVKTFMENFDVTKAKDKNIDPKYVTPYMMNRFSICGSPDECAHRVRNLVQTGIRDFLLTVSPTGYRDTMRKWSEAVMPRVAGL